MPSDRLPPLPEAAGRPKAAVGRKVVMALFGFALVAGFVQPIAALPQEEASKLEYEVKAVFLYHFTRYLQWPKADAPGGFEIAVLGESAIVAPLTEIAAKKTVNQRPILIRMIDSMEALGRPHVLFVAKTATPRLRRILEETRGKAILTVGEEDGLGDEGLAVNFVLRDGAVKFEINERVLRASGIQPSSQLLKLAIPAGGGK